jgi:hypothetical protein
MSSTRGGGVGLLQADPVADARDRSGPGRVTQDMPCAVAARNLLMRLIGFNRRPLCAPCRVARALGLALSRLLRDVTEPAASCSRTVYAAHELRDISDWLGAVRERVLAMTTAATTDRGSSGTRQPSWLLDTNTNGILWRIAAIRPAPWDCHRGNAHTSEQRQGRGHGTQRNIPVRNEKRPLVSGRLRGRLYEIWRSGRDSNPRPPA